MKYNRENLEKLSKNYPKLFCTKLEDEIFEEIEILESNDEHVKAANLFSIYINLAVSNKHAVALDKERKFVKILKEHDLINLEEFENYVIARKKMRSGKQIIDNYTIKSFYYAENFGSIIDSNLGEDFEEENI
jgi:hypothetical protein